MALEQTALPHLHFAKLHKVLVDENIQHAGVSEINEGGEEGGAGHWLFATRRQHGQGIAQNGAADTEAQCIDLFGACDLLNLRNRFDGGIFNVIIPRLLRH